MSFASIDLKIFIMINSYASYDKRTFWAMYVTYVEK